MEFNKSKAEASMENLKSEMLGVITQMGETGRDLSEKHPRYKQLGSNMISSAEKLQRRCEEALFSISLVAAFQSGKSTTVNAIADGREICPRGNGGGGIRTSSCAVKVNCALDGMAGSTVTWMTADEQDRALRYALMQENSEITLKNPEHVKDAWEIVGECAAQIAEDPQKFDERNRDQIKQALLILAYYDDCKAKEYISRNQFSEAETRRFLAFSSDVIARWNAVFQGARKNHSPNAMKKLVQEQFTVEQAMYVFISVVNYATPSEYLRSLGVQVVDTPGLNMSDNDTRVALYAMHEASAIFYFFSGERQLDESDKQALRKIQESGLANKVFFGINFRKPLAAIQQIEAAILADLELMGFNQPHQKRMLHYNAFLAQRAKQGSMILANNIDEQGRQMILSEAANVGVVTEDLTEAWLETTDAVMRAVRAEGYRDFYDDGLSEENIARVLAASRWEETMEAINDHVLHHRGTSLLVDGLSAPVRRVLGEVEATLQKDEALATDNAGQLSGQYAEAIERYNEFQEKTNKKVSTFINDSWDSAIASDFYDKVYLASCSQAAALAAVDIQKETTVGRSVGQMFNTIANKGRKLFGGSEKKSKLETLTENAVNRAFSSAIESKTIAWQESFESSPVFKNTIQRNVKTLNEEISDLWSLMKMDEIEALRILRRQLDSRLPKGNLTSDIENFKMTMRDYEQLLGAGNQLLNWVGKVFAGAGVGVGAAAGVAAIYVHLLPADFILPGIAEIGMLIAAAIAAIILFVQNFDKNHARKEVARLTEQLEKSFTDSMRDYERRKERIDKLIVGQNGDGGLQFYRKFYQTSFESALESCRLVLQKDKDDAEAAAAAGAAVREEIAKEANEIRTQVIEPMRKSMEALENQVMELAAES